MTKARVGLASDVEQYARDVEEAEGQNSLKDSSTLLEVVTPLHILVNIFVVLVVYFRDCIS